MLYRIHFNRETKNPAEAWVIQSHDGPHILAESVLVEGSCLFAPMDDQAVPQAWVEVTGMLSYTANGRVTIL